ncbi:NADH:ubiquinone reductase (Na(+)-transporting) subunit F [Pelagibacterium limicola]|uniref:NADH:ubiquinone reductase (Na(+)-transporting) subunit F n=1 Tax=Pelagibacterium limicola TaxID=2791022 RepID=UPI0018AF6EF7|nr:NADH:ubiquinone reductase (Na(+)-transporting) subunit F [Pelagibacterium limicola]
MIEIVLGSALIVVLILLLSAIVMAARSVLSPSRPVEITVNGTTTARGLTGAKLLQTLNDAGIAVPSACAGAGTCGLCKVRVMNGGGEVLPTEAARLSRGDLREGQRLACQVVIRGPVAVSVPDDILAAESWSSRVVSNEMVAPLIKELVLEVPEGVNFEFHAGGYVQIEAPPYELAFGDIAVDPRHEAVWQSMSWRGIRAISTENTHRAYSVASRPEDTGRIVLNIRLAVPPPGREQEVPPGIVSSYLFALEPGNELAVSGPFGEFRVQDTEREMLFIGGGVGMAPLRAMIHEQLGKGTGRKISFWYGARSGADIFYKEEFDALAERYANFSWTVALSEPMPEDNWDGPQGFIHEVVLANYLKDHPAPEDCEYYLCGPPLMIQAVLAMLDGCGVEPGSIFNDDFGI